MARFEMGRLSTDTSQIESFRRRDDYCVDPVNNIDGPSVRGIQVKLKGGISYAAPDEDGKLFKQLEAAFEREEQDR